MRESYRAIRLTWAVRLLESVLDWVYPQKCALCGLIGMPPVCDECRAELVRSDRSYEVSEPPLDWSLAVFSFEGRAAQAVRRLKYSRVTSLAPAMSEFLEDARSDLPPHDAIVPVPIHPARKRWRGFNQSDLLCSAMPRLLVEDALMLRVRKTRPQVELTAAQRRENLKGAFVARPAVAGKRVLIVDDVVTTGGTALACADALKGAGARQVGLLAFCGEKPTSRD